MFKRELMPTSRDSPCPLQAVLVNMYHEYEAGIANQNQNAESGKHGPQDTAGVSPCPLQAGLATMYHVYEAGVLPTKTEMLKVGSMALKTQPGPPRPAIPQLLHPHTLERLLEELQVARRQVRAIQAKLRAQIFSRFV